LSVADKLVPAHHRRMIPLPGETPAQFVRRLRGDVGREKFAAPLGLTMKTIQRIEEGEPIGKKAAQTLSRHTGVPIGWFMNEPESKPRESHIETVLEPDVPPMSPRVRALLDEYRASERGAEISEEAWQVLEGACLRIGEPTNIYVVDRLATALLDLQSRPRVPAEQRDLKGHPPAPPVKKKRSR
jgi:transcriptional regulator with XRE-family HTH domain